MKNGGDLSNRKLKEKNRLPICAFLDIQGGNQYSQKIHTCDNISGGDHQHLLLRHPKDCKNTKVRKHISEGSIGEEFQ